jgi:hypothetical protein
MVIKWGKKEKQLTSHAYMHGKDVISPHSMCREYYHCHAIKKWHDKEPEQACEKCREVISGRGKQEKI